MSRISLENVNVSLSSGRVFGSVEILHDISFELESGDRLALIGPNGAGKSTLLMAIAGILPPRKGKFEIEGEVSALFNLALGTSRQSTGRRNMILRNLIQGRSMKEIKAKLPEMIEFADIGEYIDRPMELYSQGMAMRTVFAAATSFKPDILLMDEWLGVGDAEFRVKSAQRMTELVEASGMLVLATHHQRLSREMCDKGLYLRDGKVRFFGDIDEAWECYIEDGRDRDPAIRKTPKGIEAA